MPAFSSCVERDYCLVAARGLLIAVVFLVARSTGSRALAGSAVVACGLVALKHVESSWTRD